VGLAAPQVGSDLRVAVMDSSGHPKATTSQGLLVLVNPQIDVREGFVLQREGCLSIPAFTANVRRAARIHLKAFDQFGSSREWWLEGFEAIIAQHEVDHLDGRLFLDRVANVKTDVFRRKTYW
jgi:peptide deformylase